jgi:hypothetical protein
MTSRASAVRQRQREATNSGGLSQAALLLAVLLGMRPSCFFGVMSSVGGVPVRGVRVVGGLLVLPSVVVFTSLCVMVSSMCCVFCCLLVVLGCFLGHGCFLCLVVRWQAYSHRETTKLAYRRSVPL